MSFVSLGKSYIATLVSLALLVVFFLVPNSPGALVMMSSVIYFSTDHSDFLFNLDRS